LSPSRWRDLIYDQLGLTPEQRIEWNGYRVDNATANLGYRARPLEGIWATPPFLHNGSVPNLYELLVPVDSAQQDLLHRQPRVRPQTVGYSTGSATRRLSSSTPTRPTAATPTPATSSATLPAKASSAELTDEQRWQLIEYLKSLDDTPQTAASSTSSATKPAAW
jgi:hypothetical protein